MAKKTKKTTRERGPAGNPDYVAWGSERHAQLLGLRRAIDSDEYIEDGWTLADIVEVMTRFPQATEIVIREMLRRQVRLLNTPPEPPQSDDPFAPNYAPPLFIPPVKPADGLTF